MLRSRARSSLPLLFALALLVTPASWAEGRSPFETRLRAAIQESFDYKVTIADHLGEGAAPLIGQGRKPFDPDPRLVKDTVNCMTWMQWMLSKAFATSEAEIPAVMDSLRYFNGRPAFGTRKHYVEDFVLLSEGPLRPLRENASPHCRKRETRRLSLDRSSFKRSRKYSCPLFQESAQEFEVAAINHDDLPECARSLEPGLYTLFPLATPRYLKKYGRNVGKMGLVHGLLLDVSRPTLGGTLPPLVIHASTGDRQVEQQTLDIFLNRTYRLFTDFAIFEIDSNWKPQDSALTPEEQARLDRIMACEARLK